MAELVASVTEHDRAQSRQNDTAQEMNRFHSLLRMGGVLISTCCGLGFLKPAPGTWGSVGAGALAVLWILYGPAAYAQHGMIVATVLSTLISFWSIPHAAKYFGNHDPAQVVIDEAAGVWLALALFPSYILCDAPFLVVGASVLVFRFFDILKPWPICAVERLPGALGVMSDDLIAGLAAGCIVVGMVH